MSISFSPLDNESFSRAGQCDRPDVLDLHGLHVQEALDCLEAFIENHRFGGYTFSGRQFFFLPMSLTSCLAEWIYVITGTGHHSDHIHLGHQRHKVRDSQRHDSVFSSFLCVS